MGRWRSLDVFIATALALAAALSVWRTTASFDPRFFREPDGNDAWFEADLPTVSDRVLHRWSDQSRNSRHPLFPLLTTVPVHVLTTAGMSERTALRTLVTAIAATWSATMYVFLYGMTRRRLDALVFTALAHVSSAAMFWLTVPDTYALGSITVMIPLALCAWDRSGARGAAAYTAASAASLAVTTTNWLTGIAAVFCRKPWPQALQIVANSLTAVVAIWGVQRLIFPTAAFFIGEGAQTRFVLPEGLAGLPAALRAVLVHGIVMPAIQIVPETKWGAIMSVQHSGIGSAGWSSALAAALWAALLVAGAWALVAIREPMRMPLALAFAGHLLVYSIYGEETFLYTGHMLPVLIAIAAWSTQTRLRSGALALAATLTVILAVHNVSALAQALRFFEAGAR